LQPIEKALLGKGEIHFVDWLFLLHGLKVIFVVPWDIDFMGRFPCSIRSYVVLSGHLI